MKTGSAVPPVIYLPHGAGPLPLLGDRSQAELAEFLRSLSLRAGKPSAILVISAHWEEPLPTITAADNPPLIYDYYGFPEEAYRIEYPAPGQKELALKIAECLDAAGISCKLDEQRGFDHGSYVPLKLMYPEARIPVVQLSLISGLDPHSHIAMGKALRSLRDQNVLVIGSGMSFHNMNVFFQQQSGIAPGSLEFDDWLVETLTDPRLSHTKREQRLVEWELAPSARYCHPREEHLIPLHVCYGIAGAESSTGETLFHRELMGSMVSGFLFK